MRLFSTLIKQKKQVPVVYKLGWWASQRMLEVTSFEVTVIKSQLNLFNSISQISYTVKGWLQAGSFGVPYIQAVHHCEQLEDMQDSFSEGNVSVLSSQVHALIQLTPIVGLKNVKKHSTGRIPFEITNEYRITSLRWGTNNFKFSCAGIESVIHLSQRK